MHLQLDDNTLLFGGHDSDDELTDPVTQELSASSETPVPESDGQRGGPITRTTDRFAPLPATALRRLMLSGGEAADAIRTRRDELYRNAFPRLEKRYTGDLYREGEIYRAEPTALHRGDPLSIRPVVDEHGQPGGHWWVCPIHRDDHYDEPGRCHCGAEYREVHFAEQLADQGRAYYLRDEIITWAYTHPRLHGLDGLAPSAHVWLRQAILMMMDRWGGQYYNMENDRLPSRLYLLHTPNPDEFESQLAKTRDGDDVYDSPILSSGLDPDQVSIEQIDGMPDELLGQAEEMKSQFKSDIRQAFGISDIHDSDLEDAGGLNNEGLQLEVVDRSLASQMHDYRNGWLDTLMKRLSFDGWRISFLPDRGADANELQDNLRAAAFVKQAGGEAEIRDGRLKVDDFEVDLDDSDDPPSLEGQPNLPGVGSPVPDAGGGGPPAPGGGGPAALQAEVAQLDRAVTHCLAPDAVTQAGSPVYASDADVPANVEQRIDEAIQSHDFSPVESVSSPQLQSLFRDRLTQPQGWSIDSLTRHLHSETDLDREDARTVARTEATAILNAAREDAVADLAETIDETILHYWDGPDDERVSDMCQWLKEETNPDYGGDPVPMDSLRDLQREALDRFTDDGGGSADVRRHVLHPNERHTHRSVLESNINDT